MLKRNAFIIMAILIVLSFVGCAPKTEEKPAPSEQPTKVEESKKEEDKKEVTSEPKEKFNVVATSTMLTDLAKVLGGDKVEVTGIMAVGVDPHLYQPTAGDVERVHNADMLVFNGLHFEGQMIHIMEDMIDRGKIVAIASDGIKTSDVLPWEEGVGDPHIWNKISNWVGATQEVANSYKKLDPANADYYQNNADNYIKELNALDKDLKEKIKEIPEESRVLITAHDAFNYLADEYGFIVRGVQGISTESEASTKDIDDLAQFIVDKKVKSIFVETSVPLKNIEALQEAVKAKGGDVKIGGELFSDSLGDAGTERGTYLGMMRYNIETIVNALK